MGIHSVGTQITHQALGREALHCVIEPQLKNFDRKIWQILIIYLSRYSNQALSGERLAAK